MQATEKRESIGTSSFQGLDGLGGLAKKLGTSKARHAAGTVVVCTPAWLEQGDVEGAEEGKFSPQISSLLPSDDELIWDRRGLKIGGDAVHRVPAAIGNVVQGQSRQVQARESQYADYPSSLFCAA